MNIRQLESKKSGRLNILTCNIVFPPPEEHQKRVAAEQSSVCFQGFVSFLLPCFAVDHLYLSYDDYLLSDDETLVTEGNAAQEN